MPMLPPQVTPPFDSLELVLNTARVRLNDAIAALGGDILTDLQPFTQTFVNSAWRKLQGFLASNGHPALVQSTILFALPTISPFPPATVADPGAEMWLNWSQVFDGYNYWPSTTAPVLPQDLILPIKVWERVSGAGNFLVMDRLHNGLPGIPKLFRNWTWEWRHNQLVLPGATSKVDLKIRYAAFMPDFGDVDGTPWSQQLVPIPRALDALACYICAEVAEARGDVDSGSFMAEAQAAAMALAGLPPSAAEPKAVK